MIQIKIKNVSKYFQHAHKRLHVLERINLEVQRGEFLVLFGPNGCGKTTLLNIITKLDEATSGEIIFADSSRKIGYVFQNYRESLFPWRTARQNVEFAIEESIKDKTLRKKITEEKLKEVGLLDFASKYPYQLSDGMKQLVAIARAFAYKPDFFLMDEPFSALDYDNRLRMEENLLGIWRKYKKTIIFVSHDIDEAVFLADRIAILSKRPSRIKKIIDVDLKRPRTIRTRMNNRFFTIKNQVLKVFKEELNGTNT